MGLADRSKGGIEGADVMRDILPVILGSVRSLERGGGTVPSLAA